MERVEEDDRGGSRVRPHGRYEIPVMIQGSSSSTMVATLCSK